jgi:ligand-binding SRPBCC domain-containing protein
MQRFDRHLFEQLTPPGIRVSLVRFDGSSRGDMVHLRLHLLPGLSQDWTSRITDSGTDETAAWFVDEGEKLPFFLASWHHRHIAERSGDHTLIVDDIQFTTPYWLTDYLLYPVLWLQFAWRGPVYRRIFGKVSAQG